MAKRSSSGKRCTAVARARPTSKAPRAAPPIDPSPPIATTAKDTTMTSAVVAIGGLGSIGGAALGALLVGLARATAVHLFPELDLFAIYLIMALVLLVRPQGLFGQVEARRI